MNPLSHDNIDTPIYKNELLKALEIIEKLGQLQVTIFKADADNQHPFILKEIDSSGDEWEHLFYLKEHFRIIRDLNGDLLLSNPTCDFHTRKNSTQNLDKQAFEHTVKLRRGYSSIRYILRIKTSTADTTKDLIDIVYSDGRSLHEILG